MCSSFSFENLKNGINDDVRSKRLHPRWKRTANPPDTPRWRALWACRAASRHSSCSTGCCPCLGCTRRIQRRYVIQSGRCWRGRGWGLLSGCFKYLGMIALEAGERSTVQQDMSLVLQLREDLGQKKSVYVTSWKYYMNCDFEFGEEEKYAIVYYSCCIAN